MKKRAFPVRPATYTVYHTAGVFVKRIMNKTNNKENKTIIKNTTIEKVPDWFDKELEKEAVTNEEEAEMSKLLAEIS